MVGNYLCISWWILRGESFQKTTGREFGAWFYGMCLKCEMLHVQIWKVKKTGFRPHKGGNHVTMFCSSSANSDGWRSFDDIHEVPCELSCPCSWMIHVQQVEICSLEVNQLRGIKEVNYCTMMLCWKRMKMRSALMVVACTNEKNQKCVEAWSKEDL